jgi:hypothetical protein
MGIQSGPNTMDHNLTTTSNRHPNWYGNKWKVNASQNYKHKALLTNRYNVFPIKIERIPLEGLAKATNPKNLSHGRKGVVGGHMKTQLVELNEVTC